MERAAAAPHTDGSSSARRQLIDELDRRFLPKSILQRRTRRIACGTGWLLWVRLITGLKRTFDLLTALTALAVLWPALVLLFTVARKRGGGIRHSPRLGRWGREFRYYQFSFRSALDRTALVHLPTVFNLLIGDVSVIGPRAVAPETSPMGNSAWRRYQVRPGLICLWWIRRRANIAYTTESQIDAEYVEAQSLRGDIGILLRAIPASFYGKGLDAAPEVVKLAGVPINNLTMEEALDYITASRVVPAQVCFVNADCVNIAARQPDYAALLQRTDLVLGDGIGIKLAGKILNTHIRQNINGTDLFPRLCERASRNGDGLFLLGGRPGVVEDLAGWVRSNYPGLRLCGYQHGFFSAAQEHEVIASIRESGADILLVALGAPKQDLWIQQHLERTGVRTAMGVGGLFDFYSGHIPRAPVWLREIGGEWLFRFLQEPRRMWRRYLIGNLIFLHRVFQYRAQARRQDGLPKRGA